jgi:addiction module HigA family antidote
MATKTSAYPDVAVPPGEYLAEEIEARGISQKELAKRMGRPANTINEIINGKKAITAETALQLETVMPEIPARFWLNLETDYQLTKALNARRQRIWHSLKAGGLKAFSYVYRISR